MHSRVFETWKCDEVIISAWSDLIVPGWGPDLTFQTVGTLLRAVLGRVGCSGHSPQTAKSAGQIWRNRINGLVWTAQSPGFWTKIIDELYVTLYYYCRKVLGWSLRSFSDHVTRKMVSTISKLFHDLFYLYLEIFLVISYLDYFSKESYMALRLHN